MDWTLEHGMVVRRTGTGPEVVWLHGLGEWSVSFDAITQHASLAGFTHVLPDLPGYGRSPWPASAVAAGSSLVVLAQHLAHWLRDRPPAVLVGHSMGGVLATMIAEQIPVRAIIDIDGNLTRGDCTFSAEAAAFSLHDFREHGFAAMRSRVYDRGATEPALRGYHAALTAADPAVFHHNATDLVAISSTDELAARLALLHIPVLFVAGVPGGICARSKTLLDEHRIQWVGIEPAGHWPYVDRPDAFAAEVGGFLRSLG